MFLTSLSNFQRVSCVIGAAIGRDVRVMSKDADSDRMRCARVASRRARSHRDRDQGCTSGFLVMSARQHRARRDRRRARGVRGATLCVVYGVNVPKFYSKLGVERPIHVRTSRGFDQYACRETLCNLLEINSTSLFLITEMLTRSALLVPRLKLKSTSLCRQWDSRITGITRTGRTISTERSRCHALRS